MDYFYREEPKKTLSLRMATVIVLFSAILSGVASFLVSFIILKNTKVPNYIINTTDISAEYNLSSDYHIALAQEALKSVVDLRISTNSTVKGTGVIVGKQEDTNYPIVITNRHVIDSAISSVTGAFAQNSTVAFRFAFSDVYISEVGFFGAKSISVLGFDDNIDIAVLTLNISIENIDDIIMPFGNSRKLHYGQSVMAVGNALGNGLSVSEGIISLPEYTSVFSLTDGPSVSTRVIQHTAPINNGNSGGALVDYAGNLIGINTYTAQNDNKDISNVAYSIPVNNARAIYENILRNQNSSRPRESLKKLFSLEYASGSEQTNISSTTQKTNLGLKLGVMPRTSNKPELARLEVVDIKNDGIAYASGLRNGDRIIKIGSAVLFDENGVFVYNSGMGSPSALLFEELFFYYGTSGSSDTHESLSFTYINTFGNTKTAVIDGVYLQQAIPFLN